MFVCVSVESAAGGGLSSGGGWGSPPSSASASSSPPGLLNCLFKSLHHELVLEITPPPAGVSEADMIAYQHHHSDVFSRLAFSAAVSPSTDIHMQISSLLHSRTQEQRDTGAHVSPFVRRVYIGERSRF